MAETSEGFHVSCSLSLLTCQDPLRGDDAQEDAPCLLLTADCLSQLDQAGEASQKKRMCA